LARTGWAEIWSGIYKAALLRGMGFSLIRYVHALVAAAALAVALSGCSGGLPAAVGSVSQVCQAAGPLLQAASASGNATVSGTAVQGAAYCTQLSSGVVPATTDANTPTWLPQVVSDVQTAAQVAGVVLPIIAAL
jgi:hypothetical protein